jgi:hypothetical protein
MSDNEEFLIDEWFSSINLLVAASTKLRTNLIQDLNTLLLVRDVHVDNLKFSLGDTLHLRAGLSALRKKLDKIPDLEGDSGPENPRPPAKASGDAAKDIPKFTQRQVEELLAGKSAVQAGGTTGETKDDVKVVSKQGLSALFGDTAETTVACIHDLMRDLLNVEGNVTNLKGEKALLPINFYLVSLGRKIQRM